MHFGRLLIYAGVILIVLGVIVLLLHRLHLPIGRLPGDLVWRGKHSTVYFPWVTCLVLSAVVTFLLWLFSSRR
ncbi:MAG TPA: DUF2905 domain-containing protein [Bryobacteraceae bacterium]